MPNQWFQFKQFKVQQDKAAMKVCTDACLFGAWVADTILHNSTGINNILDVGSGTGLLSLMLAQKTSAIIDAIEIETSSAEQSRENFENSIWRNRLKVIEGDVRIFCTQKKYDVVVSNPPFFENHLKSANAKRNIALHDHSLHLNELILSAKRLLQQNGSFAVLVPYYSTDVFIEKAGENGFFVNQHVFVKQTEMHKYFRSMIWFSLLAGETETQELTIKKEGKYSNQFAGLLEDYYLHL